MQPGEILKGTEIREKFLKYFEEKGHKRVKSSSLVPKDDPTLLFTNAGMVQFKNAFLGEARLGYTRAATAQKCLRVSGKHNDLEMVGRTARHHTFFEMLGNFSFGDYFKQEAIEMAWDLLVGRFRLDPGKLWITIFSQDDEASKIWNEKMKVPAEKIVRMGEEDNFWAMGDTGPCGPCSEIIIDQGPEVGCGRPQCSVACGCDRFLELWNLVFMQYNRDASGRLQPLPKPSVDTGMGLERMAAVLQGVKSNYETDLIWPLIKFVCEMSGVDYGQSQEASVSLRLIADHARAAAFLICDGISTSNEGRGYVLRRLLRRAARHGNNLSIEEPFVYKVAGEAVELMKGAYPELAEARQNVARVILWEEERFANTLEQGLRQLNGIIEKVRAEGKTVIDGGEVFKLYDTYGFPLDLAREVAQDCLLAIDEVAFGEAMEEQRQRARASWAAAAGIQVNKAYRTLASEAPESQFVGYAGLECEAKIVAIIKGEKLTGAIGKADRAEIILDRTPFYPEGGGQVGDKGKIQGEGFLFEVSDTQTAVEGIIAHRGLVHGGTIKVGDAVLARVDAALRGATALNHSATHILHAALRQVLGDHVRQSGSLVAPDRLRFDYTHFAPLGQRERDRIEELVNEKIRENLAVETPTMDREAAELMGAIALFGEKYGDRVRVVKMDGFSLELCGGTHIRATGEIGLFRIVQGTSLAAGMRRMEALTGAAALSYTKKEQSSLAEIGEMLKAKPFDEPAKLKRLLHQTRELEKEVARLKQRLASLHTGDLLSSARDIKGVKVLAVHLENMDMPSLRSFVDAAKEKLRPCVVVAGTVADGKVYLVSGVTEELTARIHAGDIIKEISKLTDGSGGGRADMAQAGGKNPAGLKEALEKVYEIAARKL